MIHFSPGFSDIFGKRHRARHRGDVPANVWFISDLFLEVEAFDRAGGARIRVREGLRSTLTGRGLLAMGGKYCPSWKGRAHAATALRAVVTACCSRDRLVEVRPR